MNTRLVRYAGWAAYLSGITAILAMVSLLLFFGLESTPITGQGFHIWGPLSDIFPIIQMVFLLVVARALYLMQRSGASGLSLISGAIGVVGMLGWGLLQFFLVIKVIPFEQEVGPVTLATAIVGVWLILVNYVGWRETSLPSRLAWIGIAAGVAFVLQPIMLSAAGGAVAWRVFMSNYFLLAGSAVVFLVSYVGFPIWAIWLGRVWSKQQMNVTVEAAYAR